MTNIATGIVGWESEDDPAVPFNFSARQKWALVWLLSAITLLTPLATSILSPAISILDNDFNNTNPTLGSMTVSIYLFGYVVGPIFIGPFSEVYGRKPVMATANSFFCLWQIGCALAPNIETLVVARFFSGVGGAACLVRDRPFVSAIFVRLLLTLLLQDSRRQYHWRPLSSGEARLRDGDVEFGAIAW